MRHSTINVNFFSEELYSGKINLSAAIQRFECYFLIERKWPHDYIKDHALRFVMSQCDHCSFFGSHAQEWYDAFVDIKRLVYSDCYAPNTFELIFHDNIDSALNQLQDSVFCRPFVPFGIYLIYDDTIKHREILDAIIKKKLELKHGEV